MAGLVNLNKARKQAERAKKKRQADENAVKHGRSKAAKTLARARTDKAARALDGKRRAD